MRIGAHRVHYPEVTSTNAAAWALLRQGAAEGTVVTADFQTQGRGRRGRSWVAPPGTALLLSVILQPRTEASRIYRLTMAAAVAAARAIRDVTGLAAGLKWPNDLWLAGGKVGGILTETEAHAGFIPWAVVGIGLNVNQELPDFPPELVGRATSLRLALGKPVERAELQEALLEELDRRYAALGRDEEAALLAAWQELDVIQGRPVWVHGAQTWAGTALHVDSTGILWVRAADGQIHPVVADDVSIRPFPWPEGG
jgi:BirA family biotin operon repressor/biotin-[acetyl-CoA-carboxylase] ligase